MYRKYLKRLMDIICSLVAIIALTPLFLIAALLIRVNLGKPVLFRQKRVGKNDKIFTLYKYRSMTEEKDKSGNLLPNKHRLTPFGKKLRTTSIDELPQLFNILFGDMSIVGPRPLPPVYLERYTPEQRRRHEVKPGLSSISAITGRVNQTWEEQFVKEVWYVDNISFILDIKIIFKTIIVVLKREGIGDLSGTTRGDFFGVKENNSKKVSR